MVFYKIPISLYLYYTHLQNLACDFHVSQTKFLEWFLEFTSDIKRRSSELRGKFSSQSHKVWILNEHFPKYGFE